MQIDQTAIALPSLTMIGCGNMAGSMLRQWLKNDSIASALIIKPSAPKPYLLQDIRIQHLSHASAPLPSTDFTILGVKPQVLKEIAQDLRRVIPKETTLISIAAGLSMETLQNLFPEHKSIIRTMPNTPCSVGKGVCASVTSAACTEKVKQETHALLSSCGVHYWLKDDAEIDLITALSGSGPAYVFYFIESLEKAAKALGLDSKQARSIARQMVIGAAALAENDGDTTASALRTNVTSKGGTTQAALEKLMDGRLDSILFETLEAAKNRAQELNN